MNGDVNQWNEALMDGEYRGLRGGSFGDFSFNLLSSSRGNVGPADEIGDIGFRVASILTPEPSALVLFGLGAAGVLLAERRRKR